jgi:hypothetical protein
VTLVRLGLPVEVWVSVERDLTLGWIFVWHRMHGFALELLAAGACERVCHKSSIQ